MITTAPVKEEKATGTVITFYSFKGGVGRSMALANLAVLLAQAGRRVLCVDWDLEAPGLDRYFRAVPRGKPTQTPNILPPNKRGGLLSILQGFSSANVAGWRDYVQSRIGIDGTKVDLIGSGDDTADYSNRLASFTWRDFFASQDGSGVIEALRVEWKAAYDYVLVDSRTGLTDASGVCTIQMPDLVLMLFAPNEQNTDWSVRIARSIREGRRALPYDRAFLTIVPVLSRFDAREESDRA